MSDGINIDGMPLKPTSTAQTLFFHPFCRHSWTMCSCLSRSTLVVSCQGLLSPYSFWCSRLFGWMSNVTKFLARQAVREAGSERGRQWERQADWLVGPDMQTCSNRFTPYFLWCLVVYCSSALCLYLSPITIIVSALLSTNIKCKNVTPCLNIHHFLPHCQQQWRLHIRTS